MKKILLSLMIAGAGLAVKAQEKGVKFGVKAGATFATMSITGDTEGEAKSTTGFYVGGTADFGLSSMFSIQPGLTLSNKGFKADLDGGSITTNLMYIEIPVNAVVNFPVGDGKVFVGAGPYYGMAISGKHKLKGTDEGTTVSMSTDVEFGDDGSFKRGDFGVNFLAGYQLGNGFNIHAGYGLGLSNVAQDPGNAKNRVLSVGLGYSF
jgi:hypothetical protein